MRLRRRSLVDEVTIERYASQGSKGAVYDAPVTVYGRVDRTRQLLPGEVAAAGSPIVLHPKSQRVDTGALVDTLALVNAEAMVTVDGRRSPVTKVQPVRLRHRLVRVDVTVA